MCPFLPVYFVLLFLLYIGANSDSIAVCQAFYLDHLIVLCYVLQQTYERNYSCHPYFTSRENKVLGNQVAN